MRLVSGGMRWHPSAKGESKGLSPAATDSCCLIGGLCFSFSNLLVLVVLPWVSMATTEWIHPAHSPRNIKRLPGKGDDLLASPLFCSQLYSSGVSSVEECAQLRCFAAATCLPAPRYPPPTRATETGRSQPKSSTASPTRGCRGRKGMMCRVKCGGLRAGELATETPLSS